jgi:hypothetical protein
MDERRRFVARLLEGEAMSDVCREFGISRKTGYMIFDRYKQQGPVALAERMHLTLKQEATRPPGMNFLQQQARFDDFLFEFNDERPHKALDMKRLAEVYAPSAIPYDGLPDLYYPLHDRDALVTACGRICMHRKRVNISSVLAGQRLGIKEVDEGIWLVSFMSYDLGFIDLEQKTLQPLDNPFGPRLSPTS